MFYQNADNELISVDVVLGATFAQGEHTALFSTRGYNLGLNARNYDVTADGRGFVMIQVSAAVDDLIVVENFFEELKRRVPN